MAILYSCANIFAISCSQRESVFFNGLLSLSMTAMAGASGSAPALGKRPGSENSKRCQIQWCEKERFFYALPPQIRSAHSTSAASGSNSLVTTAERGYNVWSCAFNKGRSILLTAKRILDTRLSWVEAGCSCQCRTLESDRVSRTCQICADGEQAMSPETTSIAAARAALRLRAAGKQNLLFGHSPRFGIMRSR